MVDMTSGRHCWTRRMHYMACAIHRRSCLPLALPLAVTYIYCADQRYVRAVSSDVHEISNASKTSQNIGGISYKYGGFEQIPSWWMLKQVLIACARPVEMLPSRDLLVAWDKVRIERPWPHRMEVIARFKIPAGQKNPRLMSPNLALLPWQLLRVIRKWEITCARLAFKARPSCRIY